MKAKLTSAPTVTINDIREGFMLRTPYNYDTDKASIEHGLECKDETRTQQHFAEEVDINTIVERFGITGQTPTGVRMPTYGDFTEANDFHSSLNAIVQAKEAFDQMPVKVKQRFNNDPEQFVEFCSQEENRTEAEKLGLVQPKTPEKVSVGPVTTSKELAHEEAAKQPEAK
ncbi:MAG: internal scaffolding protein [Microvirus sp.]|nr:MAG: internal scaffolding protein [Microvirus sp.]